MQNALTNKTILITKAREDASEPFAKIAKAGAEMIYFPTIKIVSRINEDYVKEKLTHSFEYDYLVITSGNAAEVFYKAIKIFKLDLANCKVAVIGKSTAEKCRGLGIYIHIIPAEFSSQGLLKKFSEFDLTGKKILIPGSSLSRDDLRLGLTELGAEVTFLPIYDVEENDPAGPGNSISELNKKKPDIFVFTSPSSFNYFLQIMKIDDVEKYFTGKIICTIGTTTESAVKEKNVVVNIVPYIFSLEGVADAIEKFFHTTSDVA